ncbi:MAG: hypothetical protein OEY15_02620 [Myxococcales bacterium]|nr:hypothetical protein [Myxococcales bacterium]
MKTLIGFGALLLCVAASAANAATISVSMMFEDLDWSGTFAYASDSAEPLTIESGIELTRYSLVTFTVAGRGLVWSDTDSDWTGSVITDDFGMLALLGSITDEGSGEILWGNAALHPLLPMVPMVFADCGSPFGSLNCSHPYTTRLVEDPGSAIPEPGGAPLFGIGILMLSLTLSRYPSRTVAR